MSLPNHADKLERTTLCMKGFLCLKRPFLDLFSQTPRPRGRGRPLFAELEKLENSSGGNKENCRSFHPFLSGPEKGVITEGVFSLEESLESLKSLKFSRISRKRSDSPLFSRVWGFSTISRISKFSRISRKMDFSEKTRFPKDPFFRTRFCGLRVTDQSWWDAFGTCSSPICVAG